MAVFSSPRFLRTVLLASGAVAAAALGTAWVLAQAATLAALAELQWLGLRRRAIAHRA